MSVISFQGIDRVSLLCQGWLLLCALTPRLRPFKVQKFIIGISISQSLLTRGTSLRSTHAFDLRWLQKRC